MNGHDVDGDTGLDPAANGDPAAAEITDLINRRLEARSRKDFAEADRLRAALDALGLVLMDAKDAKTGELTTTWRRAP